MRVIVDITGGGLQGATADVVGGVLVEPLTVELHDYDVKEARRDGRDIVTLGDGREAVVSTVTIRPDDAIVAARNGAMDARVLAVAKAFHRCVQNQGRAYYSWDNMQPDYRGEVCEIVRYVLENHAPAMDDDEVVRRALDAAFPGLPDGMTLEEAERRIRAALTAAVGGAS